MQETNVKIMKMEESRKRKHNLVSLTKEKQKLTMKISDTKTKQVFLETHKNNQGSWMFQYNSTI